MMPYKKTSFNLNPDEPSSNSPLDILFALGIIIIPLIVNIAEGSEGFSEKSMAIIVFGTIGYATFRVLTSKKYLDAMQKFQLYKTLREDYFDQANKFTGILGLDAEKLSQDLVACKTTLASLIDETKTLAATYIDPYFVTH
jgi:hypothetical protein